MNRKLSAMLLLLALGFGITACAEQAPSTGPASTESTTPQAPTPPATEETGPIIYTYEVEPMQNVQCRYYAPDDHVPNSPDPSKVQGKIMVWTQCPNCGEENIGSYVIDTADLDFSFGDTLMHSDTDSCWDCSWDQGIDQFMWTIRITRIPE